MRSNQREGRSLQRLTAAVGAVALISLLAAATGLVRSADARTGGMPGALEPAGAVVDTITPAIIALGDDIFHGRKGGAICATCHGKGGSGVAGMGPNLSDEVWLHGDGSIAFLESIIRSGVMKPKASGAIMPPFGGTPLAPAQLKAVAAYVYSLRLSAALDAIR